MTDSRRRSRSHTFRIVGAGLGVLLLLGAAGEIALRLGRPATRPQEMIREQEADGSPQYVADPDLGTRLKPFLDDSVRSVDYVDVVRTDHAGFVNPEPWPARIDIAVLGNSLLVGSGVGPSGSLPARLQDRLAGRRVLNLGLVGGGMGREYTIWRKYAEPLHPSLVIATIWTTWDIDNTRKFAHWVAEGRADPDYTHYRMTYSETHRRGRARPNKPSMAVRLARKVRAELARSYLVSAAYRRAKLVLGGSLMKQVAVLPNGDTLFLSLRDQERLAQGFERQDTPDLRDLFFGPLERMRSEIEAQGGHLLVVLVPSKEEIYGADTDPQLLRPVRTVRSELEKRGLPMLDLYPVFQTRGQEQAPFFRSDMHLTAFGTRIAVDAIADWIADHHIFDPGAS